ncbi:MAG: glycosyltransferase family 2 protein [Pyrinomonadaceae bacterium]
MADLLPISVIVPTRNRPESFENMRRSLAAQAAQPQEMIVIDASDDDHTKTLCESQKADGLATRIEWVRAAVAGAAKQRNQGMKHASQDTILFMDDDVLFEPECISRLWSSLNSDPRLGGVSSMIVNQKYQSTGAASRWLFRILHGRSESSYAGKCIGPALNLLPEDHPALPETVPVEWLNTTCSLYRKRALPEPPFSRHFTGYSFMEDVALSLEVGRNWKLANARTARIYHDSRTADYKNDQLALAKMQLVNRHFVMTHYLGRDRATDYFKLALLETFELVTPLTSFKGWKALPARLLGKLRGMAAIIRNGGARAKAETVADHRSELVSN